MQEIVLSNTKPSGRLEYIDFFRFLAIAFVTLSHIWHQVPHSFPSFIIDLTHPFSAGGTYGVDLFFIISGYCMAMTVKDTNTVLSGKFYKGFLLKRFLRIAPAYYVSILFWTHILSDGPVREHGWQEYLAHLFFVQNFFPEYARSIQGLYWTLAVEMEFYLIFPLVFYGFLKRPLLVIVGTALLSLVVMPAIKHYYADSVMANSKHLLFYSIYFVVGIALYVYRQHVAAVFSDRKRIYGYLAVVILCGFMPSVPIIITIVGLGVLLPVMAHAAINWEKPLWAIAVKAGIYSYSIYLYNMVFNIYADILFPLNPIGMALGIALTFCFGAIMYIVVEYPSFTLRRKLLGH